VYVYIIQMFYLNVQAQVLLSAVACACVCVGELTQGLNSFNHIYMCIYKYIYIWYRCLPQRAGASATNCHCVRVCGWIDSWTKFV